MDGVPTFVRVVCRLEFIVTYLRLCRPACWHSFSLPSLSTVFRICNLILHTKRYIITSNLSLCPPGSGWPTHRSWPLLGHLYLQWCSFWTSSASHRKATKLTDSEYLPHLSAQYTSSVLWVLLLPSKPRHIYIILGIPHSATQEDWYDDYFIPKGSLVS